MPKLREVPVAALSDTIEGRFWSKVNKSGECWLWTGYRDRQGYGRIYVGTTASGRAVADISSRVAWWLANGERVSELLVVRHTCDNPPCCNPAHLEIGTQSENMRDMAERGRAARPDFRGAKNNSAKLTEADVLRVVEMRAEGIGVQAIADEFGVKYYAIHKILSGQRWSHVTGITPKGE